MAIKPIQSDTTISVKKSENLSLSGSYKSAEGSSVSFTAKIQKSDAVKVSLQSNRSDSAPPLPPPPPGYGNRTQSRENNFKQIDSDSNGELSKDELTAAQEKRQSEGRKTPLIDRALASYDKQTQSSEKSGVSFEEFYKKDKAAPPRKDQGADAIKES